MYPCPYRLQKQGIHNLIIRKFPYIKTIPDSVNQTFWKIYKCNKVTYNQSNIIQVYFCPYCTYIHASRWGGIVCTAMLSSNYISSPHYHIGYLFSTYLYIIIILLSFIVICIPFTNIHQFFVIILN